MRLPEFAVTWLLLSVHYDLVNFFSYKKDDAVNLK